MMSVMIASFATRVAVKVPVDSRSVGSMLHAKHRITWPGVNVCQASVETIQIEGVRNVRENA